MNTLNEKGMTLLQDWLRDHCIHPPINSIQLAAWATEAEQSDPPHIEIPKRLSVSRVPVCLSFNASEYFTSEVDY
jgi:hypothetical protein